MRQEDERVSCLSPVCCSSRSCVQVMSSQVDHICQNDVILQLNLSVTHFDKISYIFFYHCRINQLSGNNQKILQRVGLCCYSGHCYILILCYCKLDLSLVYINKYQIDRNGSLKVFQEIIFVFEIILLKSSYQTAEP